VARKVQQPDMVEICPACGASGKTSWGTCQSCGHYYLAEGWTQVPRRRHPLRWIMLGLGVVAFLCVRITTPFMPDPLTSVFHRPTTQLSSTSFANRWAMWGGDLQQRRYVAEVPRQPEGHRAWAVTLGTPTRSVPVVVDDILYIGGHFTLLALDAHTGQRRWEMRMTGPVHTSPAVAGNQLYLGLQDWRVLALDRETGQTRWEFQMQNPVAGSAAVAQGMVYIGSLDGFLYALDAATGKRIWQFKTREQPLSPPAFSAGTLFVSSTEGILYALHARTGYTRLRFRTRDRLQDTPVVANGLVYFPSGSQIYAVAADAREFPGQYQLQLVWAQLWIWQFPVPRPPAQPGSRWRFSPWKPPHGILSAPAVAPEAFYVGDTEGYLYARNALTGEGLWQFQAGGALMASPVIVGPRVYFGTDDGWLYALDRTHGELLWKLSLGASIHATPVFASGRLYVQTTDGWLHAIE
jgi:outer membrane protein assembly factor BamB